MRALSGSFRGLTVLLLGLGFVAGGCGLRNVWHPFRWESWLDPTRNIAESDDEHRLVDIQLQVDENEQYSEIFPNAAKPTIADLEWSENDYVVGPGDVLDITVLDLFGEGREAGLRRTVSNEGYIMLPFIDRVKVSGLSSHGIVSAIEAAYQPDILLAPVVSVTPVVQLENTYAIAGAVARPNRYNIPRREFRLLEALATSGDVVQSNLEYLYVVRKSDRADALRRDVPSTRPAAPVVTPETMPTDPADLPPLPGDEGETPTPEPTPQTEPSSPSDLLQQLQQYMPGESGAPAETAPAPEANPAPDSVEPSAETPAPGLDESEAVEQAADAVEAVADADEPAQKPTADEDTEPAGQDLAGQTDDSEQQIDELRDLMGSPRSEPTTRPVKPVEMMSLAEATEDLDADETGEDATADVDPDDPLGWAQQDISDLARIIVIDLKLLKQGDPSQNIIIRDGDTIMVPPLTVGEFYMSGEVNRPGSYSLTGRKVTIKQALAAAAGFQAMAWPSNSVLIRRLSDTREIRIPIRLDRILAGKEPDIMLKPDDHIAVGSSIFSPFLAVLRNSFRSTYGFGFIYDRNFAEKDRGQFNNLFYAF